MDKNSNFETSLKWIVSIFNKYSIDYQLVGGVAARAYGSQREINDIDFYIDFNDFARIENEIKPYLTWGPSHYVDSHWDITFLKLFYNNQQIEIGNSNKCFIFSKQDNSWIEQVINFDQFNEIKVSNTLVKVIKKENLIKYKMILHRDVDIQDIKMIENQ